MAGYQTIEALRPILHPGPPRAPVVDRSLVAPGSKPRRGKGHPLKASQVKEIVRRREAGEGIRQIARSMGISHEPVVRYTKHLTPPEGGWPRPARQRKEYDVAKAGRMRRAGFTWDEIGEEIGCVRSWVPALLGVRKTFGPTTPVKRFVRTISELTGFTKTQLRQSREEAGVRSAADLAKARHMMFWLARRQLGWSYLVIANSLGGFNHTSILYGVRRVDEVAQRVDLGSSKQIGRIARRLWNADWSVTCR